MLPTLAAAYPCGSIKFPLALIADVSEPVTSTLPAGVLAFSFANIMPTAALAPTAEFARPEAVTADVPVATVAAYSMLCGTTMAIEEAVAAAVAVATPASANLATAEAVATDLPSAPADAPIAMMAPATLAATVSSVVAAVAAKKEG
jgi:hypothetical protein